MKNMKIGFRLAVGFAVVLVLMCCLVLVGLSRMATMQDQLEKIVGDNMVKTKLAQDMTDSVRLIALAIRNSVLLTEAAEMTPEIKRITDQREAYRKTAEKLTSMTADEKGKAILAKIEKGYVQSTPLIDKTIELAKANQDADAIKMLLTNVKPIQTKWLADLNEMQEFEEQSAAKQVDEARASYRSGRILVWSMTVFALLIGMFAAWFITRSIVHPLQEAVHVAETVAAGDLTSNIKVHGHDETGQLLQALKNMNDALANIVAEVRNGTETIATASQQIASGNADLSSRTEEQASSLEETASSMEELTSTVKQNADNARQANQLAVTASDIAVKGGAVVSEVVETMGSINDSAKKIVDIITVIDGIAFQTNILALNAAVEAARAGEQGRGFAVVAAEVRSLAQRSAAAAKEIKVLINNSVEKVDAGSKLVDHAGTTMQEVVEAIKRVTDIMAEISAASQEQTTGIEQVHQAISQMDQVTQQNAALVEEAAAASEAMQDQAVNLTQVVSVFKVSNSQNSAAMRVKQPSTTTARPAANVTPLPKKKTPPAQPLSTPSQAKRLIGTTGDNDWEEF